MKRIVIGILVVLFLTTPVAALEITAPTAPESAEDYMPDEPDSFGEGVWYIIRSALTKSQPYFAEGAGVCLSLIAIVLLLSLFSGMADGANKVVALVGTVAISVLLFRSVNSMVNMGADVVVELSDYGKLFIPVMSTALAAQGCPAASAALYAGTVLFSTLLSGFIANLLVPSLYIFVCLCIACSAMEEVLLQKLRDFVKWLITWGLKILLYVFTGYMTVTGVVSGTADASAIKAAKLTLSGVVPVVGGILSDASEAVLVSAGVMKSSAGIYGMLVILSIVIVPFFQVGIQHLLLKVTAAICGVIGDKNISALIQDFSTAMGLILGMIGTMSLLLMIGTVCFMKGVG